MPSPCRVSQGSIYAFGPCVLAKRGVSSPIHPMMRELNKVTGCVERTSSALRGPSVLSAMRPFPGVCNHGAGDP